jgi:AcrR family transcriptional regulator
MVAKRERLSRESWLQAALQALCEGGVESVKILRLAAALGVSRGSFYWHFADRQDLLQSVLQYWLDRFTSDVISRASTSPGDASRQLLGLMEDVLFEREGRFDPAVRAWALHDPKVAAVVSRADRQRLTFITSLFREIGFDEDEAAARGRLGLLYLVGDHVLVTPESAAQRRKLLPIRHKILVGAGS